jgi:CheY-like chemotaxis protein
MMRRILLVEDNADSRELFSLVIRRLGYEVLEAESGPAALEKVSSELPDLILMDVSLPGMNGIEATAWIKSNPFTCHIPVLICSAWQNQETVAKALTSGAVEFLMKPVSPDSLREVLGRYLGSAEGKGVDPITDVDGGSSRSRLYDHA